MNHFDFDDMMNLFKQDPIAFEQKRKQMIEETIMSAPTETQSSLRKLQYELDQIRVKQPTHFMHACFSEISSNLKSLDTAWGSINSHLVDMKQSINQVEQISQT